LPREVSSPRAAVGRPYDAAQPGHVPGRPRARPQLGTRVKLTHTSWVDEERRMEGGDEIRQLLREIRDAQREQLAEYRRVTERPLELEQRAVARQGQIGHPYRRPVRVGGGMVGAEEGRG